MPNKTALIEFENALAADRVATRFAMEHDSPEALKKYLKEHPDADRSKHHVKKDEPEAKAKKEESDDEKAEAEERKTFKPSRFHKDLGSKLQEWQGPGTPGINSVGSHMTAEKPFPREKLKDAIHEIDKLRADKSISIGDKRSLGKMQKHLKNLYVNG